jgi:hypothetical protein
MLFYIRVPTAIAFIYASVQSNGMQAMWSSMFLPGRTVESLRRECPRSGSESSEITTFCGLIYHPILLVSSGESSCFGRDTHVCCRGELMSGWLLCDDKVVRAEPRDGQIFVTQ